VIVFYGEHAARIGSPLLIKHCLIFAIEHGETRLLEASSWRGNHVPIVVKHSEQDMKFKPKFFRVATEGAATDGRTITREWIQQMASSYDPKKFGARIWLEHLRGTYSDDTDALQAAQAEWQRTRNGTVSMKFSMAVIRPEITPQYWLMFINMKLPIREIDWLVKSLDHN